jgi:hypothetical protein
VDYLTVVVLVVPALIGLVAAVALGPNRGSILGVGIMLVAVFVLLLFQVTVMSALFYRLIKLTIGCWLLNVAVLVLFM